MPTFEIKNATDAQDFVRGCTFYGTGGGGSPEYGLDIIMRVLKEGSRIRIVDVSEVKDDAWSCSAFGMGSIAPRTQKVLDEMKSLGLVTPTVNFKLAGAIKELQDYSGKKISVIAPVEIGGANTPDPVATAAHLGLAVVDGDYAGGRAIPEALQTTPTIEGNEIMVPLASVDEWGNTVILKKAINNAASEKIGKLVAVLAYGNLAGQATYLFSGTKMKKLIVPGTLSKTFATGKKIRQLKERGMGFEEFAKAVGGHYVFKGKVKSKDEENRDAEILLGVLYDGGDGRVQGPHLQSLVQEREPHDLARQEAVHHEPGLRGRAGCEDAGTDNQPENKRRTPARNLRVQGASKVQDRQGAAYCGTVPLRVQREVCPDGRGPSAKVGGPAGNGAARVQRLGNRPYSPA